MPEISALPAEATLTGSEMIPMVQGGTTKRTAAQDLAEYAFIVYGAANAAAVRTALDAQGLDATLTALAGQNWAANSLPIGSGADTVAQVAFSANTFPARASTGNLVAKPITDAALSVLDDTTIAAMRTTLGLPDGTYTPTYTGLTNVASITPRGPSQYMRVGNTVTVSGQVAIFPTAGSYARTEVRISLPIPSALTAEPQVAGTAVSSTSPAGTGLNAACIFASATLDEAVLRYNTPNTTGADFWYHFTYQVA